jgi:subtilisin family serine protease
MGAPADSFNGISVGSVTITGAASTFSSRGPTGDGRIKPELVAFGEDALVVDPASTTAYVNRQGTSYSCPLVAGAIALVLQKNPTWTPIQMREALMNTASNRNAPNFVIGWGIPDIIAAMNYVPATPTVDNCQQGVRVNGVCSCYDGYGGSLCNTTVSSCGIWNCKFGYCNSNATCTCFQGYTGSNCLTATRSSSANSIQFSLLLLALLAIWYIC